MCQVDPDVRTDVRDPMEVVESPSPVGARGELVGYSLVAKSLLGENALPLDVVGLVEVGEPLWIKREFVNCFWCLPLIIVLA